MLFPISSPHTDVTSESSYAGFTSLNRRSGSLGIGTQILKACSSFLPSLFQTDWKWRPLILMSMWNCSTHQDKTGCSSWMTPCWCHQPQWNYFQPNELMRWWKRKTSKVNERNDLPDFVCFCNWFLVVSAHVPETITSYHRPCLNTLEQQTAKTSALTSTSAVRRREICSQTAFAPRGKRYVIVLYLPRQWLWMRWDQHRRKHIREMKLILESYVLAGLERHEETSGTTDLICGWKGHEGSYWDKKQMKRKRSIHQLPLKSLLLLHVEI